MKKYGVEFSAGAQEDAADLAAYIAIHSSREIADNYVSGLLEECLSLALSPFRGTTRQRLRPKIRVVGFKRAVSILFRVEEEASLVVILGFAYRGRTVRHILNRNE